MKETDVAWAAGFFEGEGSLTICFSYEFHGQVSASQKAREPLDKLVKLFGGRVHLRKRDSCYIWQLASKKALPFLKKIYPYIVSPLRRQEISVYAVFYSTTDHYTRNALLDWWEQRK